MAYRYFYDTEFIEDGRIIDLVSIGVVDEHGREYYAISTEFDDRAELQGGHTAMVARAMLAMCHHGSDAGWCRSAWPAWPPSAS